MTKCRVRRFSPFVALLATSAASAGPTPPSSIAASLPAPSVAAAAAPTAAAPAATLPKAPVSPQAGSYDVGLMLGNQLKHNGLVGVLSMDDLVRGLNDAVGDRVVTGEERDAALRFMHDARENLIEKNRAAGREFMQRNAKEAGVKSMPSGLQYRVLAAGDASGKSPRPTDEVTVRYRASLSDGTEIDRSDTHDRPATFRVDSVLKGWQEAFLAMKPGAKWQLFVPPELGYGSNTPPSVPPGAVLVYDIELLHITAAAPLAPQASKRRPQIGAPPAISGQH